MRFFFVFFDNADHTQELNTQITLTIIVINEMKQYRLQHFVNIITVITGLLDYD